MVDEEPEVELGDVNLANNLSPRGAIKGTQSVGVVTVFVLVLLACAFFKSDKLTLRKMIGCAIGLAVSCR